MIGNKNPLPLNTSALAIAIRNPLTSPSQSLIIARGCPRY
jgi:hypothetical protein